MKLNILKTKKDLKKPGKFADFFLNASENKKKQIIRQAAERANKDQYEVFIKSRVGTKTP